ncbi:alpha/beta hydrolase [Paenibacillus senegalensis]|uniref:alpha/beta hydrolase n=1 Tax=Paenibacillus senegalensis TaxID=1465766 RepID=UPI000287D00F|nr:alpha/beta hydrolase [Paenibacillus senegalensis]
MSFWYGWDTPLIGLNLLLWLFLLVVNLRKTKWGLLLLLWVSSSGAAVLTWFDYSFYAEAPRIPVHMLLLMLPVMLATIVIAMESMGWLTKRVWTRTVLEWGLVLLLADVVFYLFPYGYLRIVDYVVLGGTLLLSLIFLSVKNAAYTRDKASHLKSTKGQLNGKKEKVIGEGLESSEKSRLGIGEDLESSKKNHLGIGEGLESSIARFKDTVESYQGSKESRQDFGEQLESAEARFKDGEGDFQSTETGLKDGEEDFQSTETKFRRNEAGLESSEPLNVPVSSKAGHSKGRAFVSFVLSIVLVAGSVILYTAGAVLTNIHINQQRDSAWPESIPVEAGYVLNEGATIYYEVRGEGQPLLLIPGGGGDAGFYSRVVDRLADTYKVITYDRRGNSRSKWEGAHHVEISQQARDAVAVLRTVKAENVQVFGNSSGAIVAMELAAQYPEMLDKVIAHEPPVVSVLPDSSKWKTFFAGIQATAARLGSQAGNMKFTFSVGVPISVFSDVPKDFQARNALNTDILINEEMPAFVQYQPNLRKLKSGRVDVIFAAGELSLHKEKYFARTAELLSLELDQELTVFPGHHLSYFDHAEEWADALKHALEQQEQAAP